MSIELRLHGPPGTGKTWTLCNTVIPEMSNEFGEENVMVTSFTKTAAINIAIRAGLSSDDGRHGTLHSIAFNALGCPKLIDTCTDVWDDNHTSEWKIGSRIYTKYNFLRNRLVHKSEWPKEISMFAKEYEDFKTESELLDFTDIIEKGISDFYRPPHGPKALIVDEAQDFTPLQLKLVRTWGGYVRKLFLAFDDDQAIFSFQGCDIKHLILPDIPKTQKFYLTQSYRVPKKPWEYSKQIIRRIHFREEKEYKPTEAEGSIYRGRGHIYDPQWVINTAKSSNGTSMIMTSCAYMLNEIIVKMKNQGIPFHNPYKTEDLRWNPLKTKAINILYNFLSTGEDAEFWDSYQFLAWAKEIKTGQTGLIRKQGKQVIDGIEKALDEDVEGLHTCREYLSNALSYDAIEPALKRDTNWLCKQLPASITKTMAYPVTVVKNFGIQTLKQTPKIMIGTIHSFKGTEADNVFVFPDISYAGIHEMNASIEGKDNMHRLMYVAVTRTKGNLYIMNPADKNFYDFPTSNLQIASKN